MIIAGDKLGCVRYIGKLELDPLRRMFIGIHLDAPGMQRGCAFVFASQHCQLMAHGCSGCV